MAVTRMVYDNDDDGVGDVDGDENDKNYNKEPSV